MKLLILGDTHFRVKAPQRRTDPDYMQTCLGKLGQVLGICKDTKCNAIIQVGDFFDSPDPSKELLAEIIVSLKSWDYPFCTPSSHTFFAIHGQHDLSYHQESSVKRSALRVMAAADVIALLDEVPERLSTDVHLFGANFGQDPLPVPDNDDEFKVLAAHCMVGNRPLWPGHELTGPEEYVRKHPGYDLYCLGDYHYPFSVQVGDAWVINPGCLLRTKATEREMKHRPKVVIFDTESRTAEDIYLKVRPTEEVFDLSGMNEKNTEGPDFDALVRKLQETGNVGISFKANLQAYFDEKNVPEKIRKAIWNALGEV